MERMIESRDIKHMACVERIKQLEEENKNLKRELELVRKNTRANVETLDYMYGEKCDLEDRVKELEEENEKLREEFEQYKQHYNIEKDKQQIFLMTGRRY